MLERAGASAGRGGGTAGVALLAAAVVALAHSRACLAGPVEDYRFGIALVEKFGFEDLAEKHFQRIQESARGDARLAGPVGLAAVRVRQGESANQAGEAEKGAALFAEAERLLDEALRQMAADHPLKATALTLKGQMKEKAIASLKKALEDAPSAEAKADLRKQLIDIYRVLTEPMSEAAKRAKKALEDGFMRWEGSKEAEGAKQLPPWLMRLLEAAAEAEQRYFLMALDQAEAYEAGSSTQKKYADKLVSEIAEARGFYEAKEFVLLVMWMDHALGRAYVYVGKKREAYDTFEGVTGKEDQFPGGAQDFVDKLRIGCFYYKAKAAFDWKDHETAIQAVDTLWLPPATGYLGALDTDAGNGAAIVKARAHLAKGEYSPAREVCMKVIQRNFKQWAWEARRLLPVIEEGVKDETIVDAESAYNTAFGAFQLAREAAPRERALQYEKAVEHMRAAVTACRSKATKYRTRLQYEPMSWFLLGTAYSDMGAWYEAGFAFEAVLRYFAKDVVGKELAAMQDFAKAYQAVLRKIESGAYRKDVQEGEEIDPYAKLFDEVAAAKDSPLAGALGDLDEKLKKAANNLMVSARRRQKETTWDFDAELYRKAMDVLIDVDPSKKRLIDFHKAAALNNDAESYTKRDMTAKAVEAWAEAARLFHKAASEQQSVREVGYHMAGKCYYKAMDAAARLPDRSGGEAGRARGYGDRALEAFDAFEAHARSTGASRLTDEEKEKRLQRRTEAVVARAAIFMAQGRHEETVKTADEYLKRGDADPRVVPDMSKLRFFALAELAAGSAGTPREERLFSDLKAAAAEFTSPEAKRSVAGVMSSAHSKASDALTALASRAGADAEKTRFLKAAEAHQLESANWSKEILGLLDEKQLDLASMMGVAEVFYGQKAWESAADLYRRIIERFDPDGDGESRKLTPGTFVSAAKSGVTLESVGGKEPVLRKLMSDIQALEEIVFGEPEEKRPEIWKYSLAMRDWAKVKVSRARDWQKAHAAMAEIARQHPKVRAVEALAPAMEELKFRLLMLRVRLNLADADLAMAPSLRSERPDRFEAATREAVTCIEKVRDYYWRDRALRFDHARAYEVMGDLAGAQTLYADAKENSPEYSPEWFKAGIRYSELALKQAEDPATKPAKDRTIKQTREDLYRKALTFPDALIALAGEEAEWKKHWPEAPEIVARCKEGIRKLGLEVEKGGPVETRVAEYDLVTEEDSDLKREFDNVMLNIKAGRIKEEDKDKAFREKVEYHFEKLLKGACDRLEVNLARGVIKAGERDHYCGRLFGPLLYQSPIRWDKLRQVVIGLGMLKGDGDGIPVEYIDRARLNPKAKEWMISAGLLTADGRLRPVGEVPAEFLDRAVPGLAPGSGAPPGEGASAPAPGAGGR